MSEIECRCQTSAGYWARATARGLTRDEQALAAAVALARHEASRSRADSDSVGPKTLADHFRADLVGAYGEMAYAVLFDVEWDMGVDTHAAPDFPPDIELRTTSAVRGRLIVRDRGVHLDRRYVLARWEGHHCVFLGWCWGTEAVRFPTSAPGGLPPAHFIDAEALHRLPLTLRHDRSDDARHPAP
jgi:hypothetical protein